MKIILEYLRHSKRRTRAYIMSALLFLPACALYIKLSGIYATVILCFLITTYAFFMTFSYKAQSRLIALELSGLLESKQGLKLALVICLPINWFGLIYAVIPLTSFYAWMLTGFPLIVFSFIYMKVTADHIKRIKERLLFWLIQVLIYIAVLSFGQYVVTLL